MRNLNVHEKESGRNGGIGGCFFGVREDRRKPQVGAPVPVRWDKMGARGLEYGDVECGGDE